MLFDESFVTMNVIVTLPDPDVSGPVAAGTSFAGFKSAVYVGLVGDEGEDGELLLQPAAKPSTTKSTDKRLISRSFFVQLVQKNFRLKLNPRYSAPGVPPRAACANVVNSVFV